MASGVEMDISISWGWVGKSPVFSADYNACLFTDCIKKRPLRCAVSGGPLPRPKHYTERLSVAMLLFLKNML
jgi:hypothetical protein